MTKYLIVLKGNSFIRIQSLLLLLVYLISSNSLLQFHQHKDAHVTYEKANACEKHIYFPHADINELCGHKAHISKSFIKCSLCDHHATAHYIVSISFAAFSFTDCPEYSKVFIQKFIPSDQSAIDNRGPPVTFLFLS